MFVCYKCTDDLFLSEQMKSEGTRRKCHYCGKRRAAMSLKEFAETIHSALEGHFYLTSSEPEGIDYALAKEGMWERPGSPVVVVIQDLARVSEAIAGDVRETLSEEYGYRAIRDGEENPYDDAALYEERGPDTYDFQESWRFFKKEIQTHARFFSRSARHTLDSIFEGIGALANCQKTSVVKVVEPGDEFPIYRARVAFTDDDVKTFLLKPAGELGPPPSRLVRAGRMNAVGIPVFYGALERETCLAEARAPVGSQVVTARFGLLRPIRLVDLDVLKDVYGRGESYFDPDFSRRANQAAFLRRLVEEISRPVMPNDEAFDYLPTQAVAEYLANSVEPRLEGMIFHSSQTGGKGRNIVLFNHASTVRPIADDPNVKVDINMGWRADDDYDDMISIFEEVTPPPEPKEVEGTGVEKSPWRPFNPITMDPEFFTGKPGEGFEWEPTLTIDTTSIEVEVVRGVEHTTEKRFILRTRAQARGSNELKQPTIGILAYGSLIPNPGDEIGAARSKTITSVQTPFAVEFARSSNGRGGAPTLVPVDDGGAQVNAQVFVVNLSEAEAANVLWRRERDKVGSGERYARPAKVTKNSVLVERLENFAGVDIVLYTKIAATIEPLTTASLAKLAIDSVGRAAEGRDGITYLMQARADSV